MARGRGFWRSPAGASAVEFAMVVPVFFALTLGAINMGLLLFFNSALHHAVDDTARCISVQTSATSTSCETAAKVVARETLDFNFPSLSPNFTTGACTINGTFTGNSVTGTATYRLNAVVVSFPVTIHATACFPIQD